MRHLIFTLAVILGMSTMVGAQQTIFNVPTTDVLDRGKVYVELDTAFKTDRSDKFSRFSSFVPRIVIGVGNNLEVGLNVTGNIQPGADSTTIVPTIKWKFFENRKKATALIAGTNFYIPVRDRSYNFGTYSYLSASKAFKKTRITAGGYVATNNVFASNAVRAGGQFGIEHSINDRLSLAADWITGKHSAGYFTPGLIYKPFPKVTTYFTYSIGNGQAAQGNRFFLFEIGYNFN